MVASGPPLSASHLTGQEGSDASGVSRVPPGPVLCIAGPTASGKTSLANRVARRLGSVIVGADAMQVYRGMDIGTAKDRDAPVEVRMVDVVEPDVDYSVALFQRAARSHVDACLSDGLVPVVCGGTGLYLDAIIDDLSFPEGDTRSASRRHWEDFARHEGAAALHLRLAERDPAAAALVHPNNVRRVIRALEMADQGVSYAEQNRRLRKRRPYYDARVFAITMDRGRLRDRIDRRVDDMFSAGLVTEVEGLARRGLRGWKTASQAIGYKEVLDCLDGICTVDEARELIKARTRRYAKRQLSWLRRREDVMWLDYEALDEARAADLVVDAAQRPACGPREERVGDGHGTL